jgi:hypothetical protein
MLLPRSNPPIGQQRIEYPTGVPESSDFQQWSSLVAGRNTISDGYISVKAQSRHSHAGPFQAEITVHKRRSVYRSDLNSPDVGLCYVNGNRLRGHYSQNLISARQHLSIAGRLLSTVNYNRVNGCLGGIQSQAIDSRFENSYQRFLHLRGITCWRE